MAAWVVIGLLAGAVGIALAWLWARRTVREAQALRASAEIELLAERERVREENALQELILSSMEEGIMLIEPAGRVVFSNSGVARHLGGVPGSRDALFPLEIRGAAEDAARTGATARVVVQVGPLTRFLRATAMAAGDSGSVLLVVSDVTESRRLDAIRRDFVANASHELKTPAASIQAAAETLRHAAEDDPAAVSRFATQLEREAVRLSRIVADLLDLSRLESGSELVDDVRLDALVREEEQRYREQADAAGLVLSVTTPRVPPVRGSSRDLSLLVRNLIDNAIRYTKDGGSVDVDVRSSDGWVEMSVSDSGAGIPSRDLARVFERFYRVDRARSRETGGTGLGLAIVKHVAENHGGDVTVQSELGRGSVFTVRIPSAT
jgi:two-component system, OmpR family, sensor histidine kinase SenX3